MCVFTGLMRRLAEFRAINTEDETVLNYFDELEIHPDHIGKFRTVSLITKIPSCMFWIMHYGLEEPEKKEESGEPSPEARGGWGGGFSNIKMTRLMVQIKKNLNGTRILFSGCGSNSFLLLRGTVSKTACHILSYLSARYPERSERDLWEISRGGRGMGWKMGEGHNFLSPWKGRVMKKKAVKKGGSHKFMLMWS